VNRQARQTALSQIGACGQARIGESTALIIGLGGLGCASASYLACAGVGHLMLCDFDTVDETNLGRQPLYRPQDVDHLKAECAASRLATMNPDIRLTLLADRLSDDALSQAVNQADVVLDCSDNFATRFQVNSAVVALGRVLVSGAAIRFEGQLAVFGPEYRSSPCYRCLYQEADESLEDCAGNGVLGPVPGVIGTMMAVEALKSAAGIATASGQLHLYDAYASEWRKLVIGKRVDCPTCSTD